MITAPTRSEVTRNFTIRDTLSNAGQLQWCNRHRELGSGDEAVIFLRRFLKERMKKKRKKMKNCNYDDDDDYYVYLFVGSFRFGGLNCKTPLSLSESLNVSRVHASPFRVLTILPAKSM